MRVHTAAGRWPVTVQMAAVISLAEATMAWVTGLVGIGQVGGDLGLAQSPPSTEGEKLDPTST